MRVVGGSGRFRRAGGNGHRRGDSEEDGENGSTEMTSRGSPSMGRGAATGVGKSSIGNKSSRYPPQLEMFDRAALARRQWMESESESAIAIEKPRVVPLQVALKTTRPAESDAKLWVRIPYPLISYLPIVSGLPPLGLDSQAGLTEYYSISGWFDLGAMQMREMTVDSLDAAGKSMWTRPGIPTMAVE